MAKQILMTWHWSASFSSSSTLPSLPPRRRLTLSLLSFSASFSLSTTQKKQNKITTKKNKIIREKEKRRTRSDNNSFYRSMGPASTSSFEKDVSSHVPVMLGEVVDVFSSLKLRSFVDCTLGAGGHSSAIIESHPELDYYVGMDVDPIAHEKASARIDTLLHSTQCHSHLKAHILLKNFSCIKSMLNGVDSSLLNPGINAILMDLGMSSMQVNDPGRGFSVLADGPLDMRMDPQASLTAKDILNSWPDTEVGRILRDYGEESNWRLLQNKIVRARLSGGFHSTTDLVDLIRSVTHGSRGGRQGWIKTATRVFQALRIAVNDELNILEKSLHACFECLAPGGRLAVISFHSLEDRIVKQTFLNIIKCEKDRDEDEEGRGERDVEKIKGNTDVKETWIRQMVRGKNGAILTRRPITPSHEEEKLNRRCRSAKLRVLEKL